MENRRGEISAEQRAQRGRDFEEHADADVGEAFAYIGCGRTRRSGDDRDQRGADGVTQIDVKDKREQRAP